METTAPDPARLRALVAALVRRFQLAERADVACCGTTVAQAAALSALAGGPLRLGELASRLGISPSTLTRNLARLEDRGLVRRLPGRGDGRVSKVELTAEGRAAEAAVESSELAFARSILELLPPERAAAVLDAMEDLLAAVRDATRSCCPGAFDHLMTGPPWGAAEKRRPR